MDSGTIGPEDSRNIDLPVFGMLGQKFLEGIEQSLVKPFNQPVTPMIVRCGQFVADLGLLFQESDQLRVVIESTVIKDMGQRAEHGEDMIIEKLGHGSGIGFISGNGNGPLYVVFGGYKDVLVASTGEIYGSHEV